MVLWVESSEQKLSLSSLGSPTLVSSFAKADVDTGDPVVCWGLGGGRHKEKEHPGPQQEALEEQLQPGSFDALQKGPGSEDVANCLVKMPLCPAEALFPM